MNPLNLIGLRFILVIIAHQISSIGSRSLEIDDYSSSTVESIFGISDNESSVWTERDTERDTDPCSLVLPSSQVNPIKSPQIITISHSVFNVSKGIVPGVTYQELPWGQMPVIELDDGSVLAQTLAIARYIAKTNGLAGSSDWESAKCDEYVYAFNDFTKVSFEIPMDHEFVLEYWLNLSSSGTGSDEARLHYSYPPSTNKKRRHQRDRRENQWLEVSVPGIGNEFFQKTATHQPIPCSKNAFGGIYNDSSASPLSSSTTSSSHVFVFNWFLKANPIPISPTTNVVFRLRFRASTIARSSIFEQTLSVKVNSDCNFVLNLQESENTRLTLDSLWNSEADNIGLNCTILLVPFSGFGLEARFTNLSVYGIRDLCNKGRYLIFNSPEEEDSNFQHLDNDPNSPDSQLLHYKYCGKIEDYASEEKILTFTASELRPLGPNSTTFGIILKINLPGFIKPKETFSIDFLQLSPCDKVLLSNLSGTLAYERHPSAGESVCSIVIHVPYGNIINTVLTVNIGQRSDSGGSVSHESVSLGRTPDSSTSILGRTTRKIDHVSKQFDSRTNGPQLLGPRTNGPQLLDPRTNGRTGANSDSGNEVMEDENSNEFECILNSRNRGLTKDGDHYFVIRVEEFERPRQDSWSSETDKHHRIFCLTKRSDSDAALALERGWKSVGNRMKINFGLDSNFPSFRLSYSSESVAELRRNCDEGWVHIDEGSCVLLVERNRNWMTAEEECQEVGGHLVTVKNDLVQRQLQEIIINSASFQSNKAYWTGANDREAEGNFQWTSGLPFIFTNWFPGSRKDNGAGGIILNVQPNDDGLSGQDCVELRQDFTISTNAGQASAAKLPLPHQANFLGKSSTFSHEGSAKVKSRLWPHRKTKQTFHWNDRNCHTLNYFLCERATHLGVEFVCNRTLRLGPGPSVTVTSPGYPSSYPDNILCITRVDTIPGYRIVLTFDEFHLENSPNCKYDSLEFIENSDEYQTLVHEKATQRTLCGDWNRKLKLLRYASKSSSLSIKFESDFSHALPGFKAKVSIEKVIPLRSYEEEVSEQCAEQHMQGFRTNCYLVVSSPTVNYDKAQQLCSSLQGNLASIITIEEWRFITQILATSAGYQKKMTYWLGGYIDKYNQLVWKDGMPFNFSSFHPSDLQSISEWKCLSLYWHEGGKGTFAWRLSNCNQLSGYICKKATKAAQAVKLAEQAKCNRGVHTLLNNLVTRLLNYDPAAIAIECCMKGNRGVPVESRPDLNRTFVGIGGKLTSPNFPLNYKNNLDYIVQLTAPVGTVIVLQFQHVDIEFQDDCLYDYLQLIDRRTRNSSQVCGSLSGKDLERYDYVSTSNTIDVIFHSDFSEALSGFELIWRAVDITECLSGRTIITGLGNGFPLHQGSLHSPNFPYFNLPSLNCVYTIVAPAGQRIWFHFDIFEIGDGPSKEDAEETGNTLTEGNRAEECSEQDHVVINLLSDSDSTVGFGMLENVVPRKSIVLCGNLTSFPHRTSFVSYGEKIRIHLISREGRRGRGFLGKFKTLSPVIKEQFAVQLEPNSSFLLTSLNYPFQPPPEVNLTIGLTSPPNYIITLEIRGTATQNCHLKANSYIVIHDPYVGTNGTSWIICNPNAFPFNGREGDHEAESEEMSNNVILAAASTDILVTSRNILHAASTTSFHSTFNRLEVTQAYKSQAPRRKWNAEVVTSLDENFRAKVLSGGDRLLLLNACSPNPCLNGGKCITDGDRHICRCPLPYTGPFCGLSVCDLSPCLFGDCFVEDTSYRCSCHIGYAGEKCDRRAKPCMRDAKDEKEKCNGHGECVEVNDSTYKCLCYAFWEGPRCEARMQNIPFRPLSERMLREPFWLGIITVFVVLGVIGLVWCLKRHFPEKLEKFLNEDLDRNRRISWVCARSPSSFRLGGGCSYHGVRDPIAGTSQQATSPQAARSFLGRFAIRKPSLLSLSSATSVSAAATSPHTYENRTFSLDDLLRPSRSSMMRTPSPHRRRNFSIHSRRDPMEKQQILQQLVSSGASVSLDGSESKPSTPKPTIAEIIQMSEKRLRLASLASASSMQNEPSTSFSIFMDKAIVENETSFSNAVPGGSTPTSLSAASKAEKKVTFARLLDKLTAHDMSSSSSCSDLSCAEENSTKTIMVNPKPPKKDKKGRLKRTKAFTRAGNSETDQDGFEMSSSDTTPDPIFPPRFPSRACVSPTGLSVSANNSPSFKPNTGKSLPKMASADSLLALFRRFSGSSSAPPSPQYSENEESSAGATPLSTPSSPRNSALSLNIRPPAFLITTPEHQNTADASAQPDPYTNQGGTPGSWRSQAQNMSVISLEVPMREHCLSPIHEVPTPLPTPSHSPAHSPMMHRQNQSSESNAHAQGLPMIRLQASSDVENDEHETETPRPRATTFPLMIPKIAISQEGDDDCMIMLNDPEPPFFDEGNLRHWTRDKEAIPDVLIHTDVSAQSGKPYEPRRFTFDSDDMARVERRLGYTSDSSSPSRKGRPPPLVFANEIMSETKKCPKDDEGDMSRPIIIPVVNVQDPTPVGTPAMTPLREDDDDNSRSDPLSGKTVPIPPDITAFAVMVSPKPWEIHTMRQHAHAPLIPPIIMINQNSEAESDSDTTIRKLLRKPNLAFLSPFAGTSDRVPSESNLSTSGYSSMASPCPSRCPSVSPLCPDTDEYHGGGHHHHFRRSSLVTPGSSRKSSLTLTPRRCSLNATSPLVSFASNLVGGHGLGIGSTGAISSFGESMELLAMEMEHDSALEIETDPDAEIKKIETSPELCEDFLSLSHLLQVPRKNLPKSHSLDMDVHVPEHDTQGILSGSANEFQRSPCVSTKGQGRSQLIQKGASLDSKLNSRGTKAEIMNPHGFHQYKCRSLLDERMSEVAKRLSPVSSRSDSSMSELSVAGLVGGFASPITDSDGVYDCASSEVQSAAGGGPSRDFRKSYANSFYLSPSQQIRRSGRRKNRRRMSSGTKKIPTVPLQDGRDMEECRAQGREVMENTEISPSRLSAILLRPTCGSAKKTPTSSSSPKRRVRAQTNLDASSSSSESLNSLRSSRSRMSSPSASPKQEKAADKISPEADKISSTVADSSIIADESPAGPNILNSPVVSPSCEGSRNSRDRSDRSNSQVRHTRRRNISRSRLRTITLQIRFLRRLERSLLRKRKKLNSTKLRCQGDQKEMSSNSSCSTCTSSSSICSSSCTSSSSDEDGS